MPSVKVVNQLCYFVLNTLLAVKVNSVAKKAFALVAAEKNNRYNERSIMDLLSLFQKVSE